MTERNGAPRSVIKRRAAKPKTENISKSSALSEEFIVDSDSSDGKKTTKAIGKSPTAVRRIDKTVAKAPLPKINASTPAKIAPTSSDLKAIPPQQVAAKRKSPDDSENESSSEREPQNRATTTLFSKLATRPSSKARSQSKDGIATKPTLTTKQSQAIEEESSSGEEDSNSSETSLGNSQSRSATSKTVKPSPLPRTPTLAPKKTKQETPLTNGARAYRATSDSSASDASSSEEEGSESTSETDKASEPATTKSSTTVRSPITATFAYKPPPGFLPATVSLSPRSHFPLSNLGSKQIWHLTLPASIPISAIEEVPLNSIVEGTTALIHNGLDFAFISTPNTKEAAGHVLMPSDRGKDYRAIPKGIAKTLHLQQVLHLPNLALEERQDGAHEAQVSQHMDKVVHEQPQGLRMRYRPFGDEEGELVHESQSLRSQNEDEIGDTSAPTFRVPPGTENTPRREKRRRDDMDGTKNTHEGSPSAKKRHKSRRVEQEKTFATEAEPSSQILGNITSCSPIEINVHTDEVANRLISSSLPDNSPRETPEEKARRRAEASQARKAKKARRRDRAEDGDSMT
ncbi:hypothetical protein MMC19_004214 [Ptychographa xylographoides]|nr:hypothetical protein [Ptychographa xylographoides]